MGYYTYFTLEYSQDPKEEKVKESEMLQALIENNTESFGYYKNLSYSLFEELFDVKRKWYDYEIDMIKLSKQFPTVKFTLWGEGDEREDMWVHYFYNGKHQYSPAKISFDTSHIF